MTAVNNFADDPIKICELLISNGADPESADDSGMTPYTLAVELGHLRTKAFLSKESVAKALAEPRFMKEITQPNPSNKKPAPIPTSCGILDSR